MIKECHVHGFGTLTQINAGAGLHGSMAALAGPVRVNSTEARHK